MLTKDDIKTLEKVVRKVVREEIEAESENLDARINSELKLFRMKLQNQFYDLAGQIKNIQIKLTKLQKDITQIKLDLRKTSDFLDRENLKTLERVQKLERRIDN